MAQFQQLPSTSRTTFKVFSSKDILRFSLVGDDCDIHTLSAEIADRFSLNAADFGRSWQLKPRVLEGDKDAAVTSTQDLLAYMGLCQRSDIKNVSFDLVLSDADSKVEGPPVAQMKHRGTGTAPTCTDCEAGVIMLTPPTSEVTASDNTASSGSDSEGDIPEANRQQALEQALSQRTSLRTELQLARDEVATAKDRVHAIRSQLKALRVTIRALNGKDKGKGKCRANGKNDSDSEGEVDVPARRCRRNSQRFAVINGRLATAKAAAVAALQQGGRAALDAVMNSGSPIHLLCTSTSTSTSDATDVAGAGSFRILRRGRVDSKGMLGVWTQLSVTTRQIGDQTQYRIGRGNFTAKVSVDQSRVVATESPSEGTWFTLISNDNGTISLQCASSQHVIAVSSDGDIFTSSRVADRACFAPCIVTSKGPQATKDQPQPRIVRCGVHVPATTQATSPYALPSQMLQDHEMMSLEQQSSPPAYLHSRQHQLPHQRRRHGYGQGRGTGGCGCKQHQHVRAVPNSGAHHGQHDERHAHHEGGHHASA